MRHVTGTSLTAEASPGSSTHSGGQPILPMLVPFPIACFTGAFVTDLVYWQTAAVMWERFSDWLITAGMVMAGLAIIAFVIDLVARQTDPHAGLASRGWLRYRFLALAVKCLRSQPRRLHRSGADRA